MDFKQQADKIRREQSEAVDAARANTNLSVVGRQRVVARAHLKADRAMRELREAREAAIVQETERLERRAFGPPSGTSPAEFREALSFVDQHATSSERAEILLNRARRTGDTLLARAVANVASEKGYSGVVGAYRREHDSAGELSEFQAFKGGHARPQAKFAASMNFTVRPPDEIRGLGINHLENLADEAKQVDQHGRLVQP